MSRLPSIPLLALLGAATACLQSPSTEATAPQCEVTADCDTADGEICDEGICWGGPPSTLRFAAILAPPDDRSDLATTELPLLSIADDGDIAGLQFGPTLQVAGRVVLACDAMGKPAGCGPESSVAARLTFERDSRIPGGPRLKRSVDAAAGVGPDGEPAFRVLLPALMSGERYDVTITPLATNDGAALNPAAVAPPSRITLDAGAEPSSLVIELAAPEAHRRVEGRVRSEFSESGEGLPGLQVFARGRWSADGALVRASNLVTTGDTGTFSLLVPVAMEDSFDIVVRPPTGEDGMVLERRSVNVPDPVDEVSTADPVVISDIVAPPAPNRAPFVVTVAGTDPSGKEVRIGGAQLAATTVLEPSTDDPDTIATYTATGTTSLEGTVELMLYPGESEPRSYRLQVVPPQGSLSATLYGREVEVAGVPSSGRGFLQKVVLDSRIPVSGTVVSAEGDQLPETSVTVAASRLFRAVLDSQEQQVVDALAYEPVLSGGDGGFVVWVDPTVASTPAIYDVEVVPPTGSGSPRWSLEGLEIESTTAGSLALGDLLLPPAAWARGIVSAGGAPVAGAEIRIYEISGDSSLCEQLFPSDASSCQPAARLRGIWRSQDDGSVAVVIPDPD